MKQKNTNDVSPPAAEAVAAKKKLALFTILTILAAAALLICVLAILRSAERAGAEEEEQTVDTAAAASTLPEEYFVDPDYTTDISTIREYMSLNRRVYYTRDNQRQEVTESFAPDAFGEFFFDYFSALREGFVMGEDEDFSRFFSELYYESNPAHTSFAPQKVYDIEVELRSFESITDESLPENLPYLGSSLATFDVKYKIYRNDGTYRKDIAGDYTIPQIMTLLVAPDGDMSINSISYYRHSQPGSQNPSDGLMELILPLAFAALFLFSALGALLMRFIRIGKCSSRLVSAVLSGCAASFLFAFVSSMFISSSSLRLVMLVISACVLIPLSLLIYHRRYPTRRRTASAVGEAKTAGDGGALSSGGEEKRD